LETATLYGQSIQLSVAGVPERYAILLRKALSGINPDLSPVTVKTYTEQVAVQFDQQRLMADLTAMFSLLAVLLASIGVYGVIAYGVTRRTSEIGIRMALGADRNRVLKMILRIALLQVSVGLALGLPVAILCGRYLAHQLYGIAPFDPLVMLGATIVLGACALVAGFVPACRAAGIQPLQALRTQ
jgi:ABC-type antimicrobial peptide transport system permease subunit